jgi:transcriptional regulator with XRE-family HTH domain
MQENGLTQAELADKVNAHLIGAGHEGTVSDRTVRNWLTGKTGWPHARQREALEAVFGLENWASAHRHEDDAPLTLRRTP